MGMFVTALVLAFVSSLPLDIGRGLWLKKWLILLVGLTLFNELILYLSMPLFIGPFWGVGATVLVILGAAANAGFCLALEGPRRVAEQNGGRTEEEECGRGAYRRGRAPATPRRRIVPPALLTYIALGVLICLPIVRSCSGCSVFRAEEYRAFVASDLETRTWSDDLAPVDPAHIRMVDENQARRLMKIALGQAGSSIGSRYTIGELTVQRVRDELYWVAPLEFEGFASWYRWDTTPGYLMVSALDPSAQARLVMDHRFRYMRSAYFGDNLERHIYTHGYQFRGYTDYSFELDDDLRPYWVVTLYTPTIAYRGERVDGCIVVDPETGAITEYGADEIPAWADRIIPQNFAIHRLDDYGILLHGWWNSVWGKNDVFAPTEPEGMNEMWLVWGSDNQPYWFTGLSSLNQADNSLIGFALMDSRTGHTRLYRTSGADEIDVLRAVNAAVSNYAGYQATQPILYNIYGELTWAVPVISGEGVFQRIALAHGPTGRVVIGENKRDALTAYRRLLQTTGNREAPTAATATFRVTTRVRRIASEVRGGNTVYFLTLESEGATFANAPTAAPNLNRMLFTASSELSFELPMTQVGDRTTIEFTETEDAAVPMTGFNNLEIEDRTPTTSPAEPTE